MESGQCESCERAAAPESVRYTQVDWFQDLAGIWWRLPFSSLPLMIARGERTPEKAKAIHPSPSRRGKDDNVSKILRRLVYKRQVANLFYGVPHRSAEVLPKSYFGTVPNCAELIEQRLAKAILS